MNVYTYVCVQLVKDLRAIFITLRITDKSDYNNATEVNYIVSIIGISHTYTHMCSYKVANDVPHDQWHWTVLVMWPIKIHIHTHTYIYLRNCNFSALPHEQMTKMSFISIDITCICPYACIVKRIFTICIIMFVRLAALPTDKITLRASSNSTLSHCQPTAGTHLQRSSSGQPRYNNSNGLCHFYMARSAAARWFLSNLCDILILNW